MEFDISEMADVVEALQQEIEVLNRMDPYDPQITLLQNRLQQVLQEMYTLVPRGV